MSLDEVKELLISMGYENTIVFENPDYASAIVGIDYNSGALIYDYNLMIEHLMKTDNMSEEDAIDFIEYNTMRTIPYMSEGTKPIVMTTLE